MKYCASCGKELTIASRYCGNCGEATKDFLNLKTQEIHTQFCGQCGAPTNYNYCSNCGSVCNITKIPDTGAKASTPRSNAVASNKKQKSGVTQTLSNQPGISMDAVKQALGCASVKPARLFLNAGIFTAFLTVLMLVLTFVGNALMQNAVITACRSYLTGHADQYTVLHSIEEALDFKSVIWSMFHGFSLNASVASGSDQMAWTIGLPFLLFPITMLLIWLSDTIRKAITGEKRTVLLSVTQAFCYGVVGAIISAIFRYRILLTETNNEWLWNQSNSFFDLYSEHSLTMQLSGSVMGVFFSIFLLTLFTLLLLPGLELVYEQAQKVRKVALRVATTLAIFALITGIALYLPATKDFLPGTILLLPSMIGAGLSAAYCGNFHFISMSQKFANAADIRSSFGKLQFQADMSDLPRRWNGSASSPFTALHIVLWVALLLVLFFLLWKLWSNVSMSIVPALLSAAAISFTASGTVTLIKMLCQFTVEYKKDSTLMQLLIGNGNYVSSFFAFAILLFVINVAAYFLCPMVQQPLNGMLHLHEAIVIAVICVITFFSGYLCTSSVHTEDFHPIVYNVLAEGAELYNEEYDDELDYSDRDISREADNLIENFCELFNKKGKKSSSFDLYDFKRFIRNIQELLTYGA